MDDSPIKHSDIVAYAQNKINITAELVKTYREQVNNLRDRLEAHIQDNPDFELIKMLHSGSVTKGTALKTINDIDVAVYLKQSLDVKETDLLNWLMERLRVAYSNMKPEQFSCPPGGHCVTISFKNTGGTGRDVDVVPVIAIEDEDYGYLSTKDTGEQVLTNIPLHLEFIRKRKTMQPIHFGQAVRLVKWWIRYQRSLDSDFKFKSLMAELICAHLADAGTDFSNYPVALQSIFAYIVRTGLKERILFTDYYKESDVFTDKTGFIEVFDPVNPTNNIASKYTETDRHKIVTAATDALEALAEAQFSTTKQRALEMWKIVYGPTFSV